MLCVLIDFYLVETHIAIFAMSFEGDPHKISSIIIHHHQHVGCVCYT